MRVHQMTAALAYGDAITNDILEMDRLFTAWGLDSRVYAQHIEPRVAALGRPDCEYEPFLDETGDLLIFHYSIYADNLELYRRSRNRKLVIYHNITPPEYFQDYDFALEMVCHAGRLALSDLADCDFAVADSDFNRRELVAAGIPEARTGVLPVFIGLDKLDSVARNKSLFRRLKRDGSTHLLYVGRLAPNKGCEDLIKIFYAYRQYVNSRTHLWLVGLHFLTGYVRYLEALVDRLDLREAVTLTDRVTLSDLRAYYEAADVFLYASRHEGFGVPLLESMHFGVPILAYKAAAIPETLGQAGVLFNRMAYAEIAETLDCLVKDVTLRQRVIQRQRQRLEDFSPEQFGGRLRQILAYLGVM